MCINILKMTTVTIDGKPADRDQKDMDIVYLQDKGGNCLKMQIVNGKYFIPYYRPSDMKGIKTFDLRHDDVYLPAYPRTGTHWTFEMVNMLLNGEPKTITTAKTLRMLEAVSAEDLNALPSPRVLNTHVFLSDAPKQLVEKKCKTICNLRDPKDVAVSLYNFYIVAPFCEYKGEFKDFLYMFLEGRADCNGMFAHLLDAEKFFDEHPDVPVHFQIYEETTKKPLMEVQQLSDFLGLQRNDSLCEAIAEKCVFPQMKKDKDPYAVKFDGKNILYRKGIVGDWKNWFTDEMLEDYYRVYDEKMAGSRFYERYARGK